MKRRRVLPAGARAVVAALASAREVELVHRERQRERDRCNVRLRRRNTQHRGSSDGFNLPKVAPRAEWGCTVGLYVPSSSCPL